MHNEYDDSNLRKLFRELEPKRRMQAMRGAFRREANHVRRTAIGNLRRSIRSNRDLEKGIRAVVYRRTAGFRVTIGTKRANRNGKGERGFHTNRFGQKKPVLIWAEGGTRERRTKTSTRIFTRQRKGHSTGRMRRRGFMTQTLHQVGDNVTEDLRNELVKNIERTAKKYGCK